eukprot:TRINITY_DN86196_c0_g1_i1.p1 TRINITY_DN86196_c0_g1~~TRINITY_DN86196_c0_g1_i1.p1  ORF type:complete len:403 (+),score=69.91 TRINITY_DN86196_c0_g1_i1:79-1287(+)
MSASLLPLPGAALGARHVILEDSEGGSPHAGSPKSEAASDASGYFKVARPSPLSRPNAYSLDSCHDDEAEDEVGEMLISPKVRVPWRRESSSSVPASPAYTSSKSSWRLFDEPNQTLIFFDWDDTLFPTSDLCDRLGLDVEKGQLDGLSEQQLVLLENWRQALRQYLITAMTLGSVVIITNSRRPWVETTIHHYAPNLKPLFVGPDSLKVVYAREVFKDRVQKRKVRADSPNPAKHQVTEDVPGNEGLLMKAKLEAMRQQAKLFYRGYPGQSWKNIISIGDMWYEHEAVEELGITRRPTRRENLRIKSLLIPSYPCLSQLALRLNFSRLMLPVYVRFDGDIRIDLQNDDDPLRTISEALDMPALADTGFPLHAWGLGAAPADEEVILEALGEVALVTLPCFE